MKIAIVQSNLTLKGGGERVVLKIAQHYKTPIYVAEYEPASTFEGFEDLDVRVLPRRGVLSRLPYGRASQGISYGMGFYNLDLQDEFDVVNAHMAPSHWAVNKNERLLWYCHTPLRDIYDLYEYRMAMRKPHTKPIYMLGAAAVRAIDQRAVKKIPLIMANSPTIKARISKYYNRDDAKVLGPGVDCKDFSNKGDGKYFLYPSRISPNKRQVYAIEAFRIFASRHKDYKLVISGPVSKDKAFYEYYRKIKALAKGLNVEFLTEVSDRRLTDLYSRCTAVLFPPMNEDYGIVPLEGMASGKPIIAVNEGGPRETILHNKTGMLVNSPEGMAAAMWRIAKDGELAVRFGKAGRKRAVKEYSWERFFSEFDKQLKRVSNLE